MTQAQLKRWFITPYITLIFVVLAHILSILWRQGIDLAWSGAAVAGIAVAGTFLVLHPDRQGAHQRQPADPDLGRSRRHDTGVAGRAGRWQPAGAVLCWGGVPAR